MNGTQAKELVLKHFDNEFNKLGFKLKKSIDTNISYYNRDENGFNYWGNSFNLYYPRVQFGFVVAKRIKIIENIFSQLNQAILIDKNYNQNDFTLYLNHKDVNMKLIYAETEEEIINGYSTLISLDHT